MIATKGQHHTHFYLRMLLNAHKNDSQLMLMHAAKVAVSASASGIRAPWSTVSDNKNKKVSRDLRIPLTGPRTPTHPSNRGPVNLFQPDHVFSSRHNATAYSKPRRIDSFSHHESASGKPACPRPGIARRRTGEGPSSAIVRCHRAGAFNPSPEIRTVARKAQVL
ncbi:MAG: hypothetical protein P8Z76_16025 [Alphaproteobacteria bacterium]